MVDGDPRLEPRGTLVRDVPGGHSTLLFHDRTESYVEGLFGAPRHVGAEALRQACEASVIEGYGNLVLSQDYDRAADCITNGSIGYVKGFVHGVINGTLTHRHVSTFVKNRYSIGACGGIFDVAGHLEKMCPTCG